MKIYFCLEAIEFQCNFVLRPSKVRKLVRTNQFQVKSTKMGTGRKFVTLQYVYVPVCMYPCVCTRARMRTHMHTCMSVCVTCTCVCVCVLDESFSRTHAHIFLLIDSPTGNVSEIANRIDVCVRHRFFNGHPQLQPAGHQL